MLDRLTHGGLLVLACILALSGAFLASISLTLGDTGFPDGPAATTANVSLMLVCAAPAGFGTPPPKRAHYAAAFRWLLALLAGFMMVLVATAVVWAARMAVSR